MAKNKTTYTGESIEDFLERYVVSEQKKDDSREIIKILQEVSGCEPQMWGPSIIGFGNYHYKYDSGHEGDAPVLAFSPRKTALTFYVFSDTPKSNELVENLGEFTMSKACIYVKKLSDIDTDVLVDLCKESIRYISEKHECSCHVK
ncbi:MAG: DUF1801 domain-containing protein [Weeksellaceae bacterium]|nr:DUF1801 domain-containing protein [Weeksellaceae bacterium]